MDFIYGLFSGAAVWEIIKQACSFAFGKFFDRKEARRKLLAVEVGELRKDLEPLQRLALDYYAGPSSQATATKLKTDMKLLANKWAVVNQRLLADKLQKLDDYKLITFRQALTMHVDLNRTKGWALNDVHVTHIFASGAAILEETLSVQHRLT